MNDSTLERARRAVRVGAHDDAGRLLRDLLAEAPDHREGLDHIGFVLFFTNRSRAVDEHVTILAAELLARG